METKKKTFFDRIDEKYGELSKKQLKLAEYLRREYKTAVFLSCVPMAKQVGISEATVVRFANALGYTGFKEMINDIQEYIKEEITTVDKHQAYRQYYDHSNIFLKIVEDNKTKIENLIENISVSQINRLVEDVSNCKKLILIGYESGAALVEYLGYHLIRAGCSLEVVTEKYGNTFGITNYLDEGTMAISIAFPRYPKEQIKLTRLLSEKRVKICAITDSTQSPLFEVADYHLFFQLDDPYRFNIHVHTAVITLFQILIFEYAYKNFGKTQKNLKRLEEYNKLFNIV